MKVQWLSFLLLIASLAAKAQTETSIEVNPDGTHTVVFHNGNTAIKVNPDGTHSTVFRNGNTSTQVNPDGSHTVIFHNGNINTQVNPDGTHTLVFHQDRTSSQVSREGGHRVFHWIRKQNIKKSPKRWQPKQSGLIQEKTNHR
jgi:hypothetical protein